jgi:hypothetical protein
LSRCTKGEASLRGHLKNSDKDEKGDSSAYIPPDPTQDKQLIAAFDYLRSAGQGSATVGRAARVIRFPVDQTGVAGLGHQWKFVPGLS